MQLLRDQLTEMTGGENDASGADQQPRRGVASHKSHLTANKADMDQILFMQHPDGNWNLNDVLKVIRINRKKLEEIIGDKVCHSNPNPKESSGRDNNFINFSLRVSVNQCGRQYSYWRGWTINSQNSLASSLWSLWRRNNISKTTTRWIWSNSSTWTSYWRLK